MAILLHFDLKCQEVYGAAQAPLANSSPNVLLKQGYQSASTSNPERDVFGLPHPSS